MHFGDVEANRDSIRSWPMTSAGFVHQPTVFSSLKHQVTYDRETTSRWRAE